MRHGDVSTRQRKRDHLDAFRGETPAGGTTTWLEHVQLVHNALPQLRVDDIDLSREFAGHEFRAPLMITGMTGGTPEASEINRALAHVSERLGIGFGLGSGRAMLEDRSLASSYRMRAEAPTAFLAWNLGGVQLRDTPLEKVEQALAELEVDALCIHLNPAQEMMQPEGEGDRDFEGVLEAIGALVRAQPRPVIVKETGAGISREVGLRLAEAGIYYVDVAGRGGTSWVGVELERCGAAGDPQREVFRDWGIPTAASLCDLGGTGLRLIASGGIRTGLDVARALALGADLAGLAAPVLRAYFKGGENLCEKLLRNVLHGLRTTMLLTGNRKLEDLESTRRVIVGPLLTWLMATGANGKVPA
ncbi:MAG TPA: type 2 isopentenyl-diphosphate Delta-isomerase [Myxococcota bacterium]|nr:type 2 isopentenyl-diphosphate Delta-isomerase [Myxococcota bacterium]